MDGNHVEASLLEQHQEKVSDMTKELYTLYDEIIELDLSDDHEVVANYASLEALQFNCAHHVKKLLNAHSPHSRHSATDSESSSKLPKLNVPTFINVHPPCPSTVGKVSPTMKNLFTYITACHQPRVCQEPHRGPLPIW